MAFRHPTDPFGDGSLQESWVFTDPVDGSAYYNNQQVNNLLIPNTSNTITLDQKYGYNAIQGDILFSTNDHSFVGDVPASFCVWMYMAREFGGSQTVSFGENGQRYNLELKLYDGGFSSQNVQAYVYLHKAGEQLSNGANLGTGWQHLCATYANGTTTFYLNGNVVGTIPLTMKWLANRTQVTPSASTGKTTDIQTYNRVLTQSEIQQIYNDNFPTPVTVTPDPAVGTVSVVDPYVNPPTVFLDNILGSCPIATLSISNAFVPNAPYTDVSPFGDDSLKERWMFTPDYNSDTVQVSSNLIDDNGLVLPYAYALNGTLNFNHDNLGSEGNGRDDTVVSTQTANAIQLSGDVDASFIVSLYAGRTSTINTTTYQSFWYAGTCVVALGGIATLNNIEIDYSVTSGGSASLTVRVDNNAVSQSLAPTPSGDTPIMVGVSYDSVTKDIHIYRDGSFIATLNNAITFNNTALIEIDGSYASDVYAIHYWDKTLSADQHFALAYNSFPDGSAVLGGSRAEVSNYTDPFNDGSLLESWSFEDSIRNDQDTRDLNSPALGFQVTELPATNKSVFVDGFVLNGGNFPAITDSYSISCVLGSRPSDATIVFSLRNQIGSNQTITFTYTKATETVYCQYQVYTTQWDTFIIADNVPVTNTHGTTDTITVAFIQVGDTSQTLFVNGQLIGFADNGTTLPSDGLTEFIFTGFLDELLVWNRPLDNAEATWVSQGCQGIPIFTVNVAHNATAIHLPIVAPELNTYQTAPLITIEVMQSFQHLLVESALITITNPIVFFTEQPLAIDLPLGTNKPNISTLPYVDTDFPLIAIYVNGVTVNNEPPSTAFPISLFITIDALDDEVIGVDVPTLICEVLPFHYVGELATGGATYIPQVFAQSLFIKTQMNYVKTNVDIFIATTSPIINITRLQENIFETVHPDVLTIPVNVTSNVAQPFKSKRVVSIGSYVFPRPLYWSENVKSVGFTSDMALAVSGDSIIYVTPLRAFSNSCQISTKHDIILDNIVDLKSLIDTSIHKIIFTDGSFEHCKINLINSPLKLNPTHEGSNFYYMDLEVLI